MSIPAFSTPTKEALYELNYTPFDAVFTEESIQMKKPRQSGIKRNMVHITTTINPEESVQVAEEYNKIEI